MRLVALIGVAFLSGNFLRWIPFDFVWWYDVAGQLALPAVISLGWQWLSLPRKVRLLAYSFFVGWLTDWVAHATRFQPDDWIAMKAGFVLLGVRSVLGFVFLLMFHFCFRPRLRRQADEPIKILE